MPRETDQIPLPKTAKLIADVIGRSDTLALAERCKYRNIYVPKCIPPDHWIMATIGPRKASLLQAAFGGELLPLARCQYVRTAQRNAKIRAERVSGKTQKEIAAAFRISTRQVQLILRPDLAERHRNHDRQRKRERRLKQCLAERQDIRFLKTL